jgi:hypothetical protein
LLVCCSGPPSSQAAKPRESAKTAAASGTQPFALVISNPPIQHQTPDQEMIGKHSFQGNRCLAMPLKEHDYGTTMTQSK